MHYSAGEGMRLHEGPHAVFGESQPEGTEHTHTDTHTHFRIQLSAAMAAYVEEDQKQEKEVKRREGGAYRELTRGSPLGSYIARQASTQ